MEKRSRKSKKQVALDYDHIEFLISIMPPEDQSKIDFAEDFIHKYLVPNVEDDDIIKLEPMKFKLLKYLLASLLWKHESGFNASWAAHEPFAMSNSIGSSIRQPFLFFKSSGPEPFATWV